MRTDKVTNRAIAKLLLVTPQAVSNWADRYEGFPKPFVCNCCGHFPVYSRSSVIEWYANWKMIPVDMMMEIVEDNERR